MSTLKLQQWFIQHHQTLSFAESCTGGALAAKITLQPGASQYFLGSFVTYSNQMKESLLGVKREVLATKGAVSLEVVSQMLQGVFQATGSSYGMAVSGVAGPGGGSLHAPVGTICYALGKKGGQIEVGVLHLQGQRSQIIERACEDLLTLLWNFVCNTP